MKSKFLSVSSMNTLLAILKVTDARRDVILAGGLNHRFPWRHLPLTDVYSFFTVVISKFKECDVLENVYKDSVVTIKVREE